METIRQKLEIINSFRLEELQYEEAFNKVFDVLCEIDFSKIDLPEEENSGERTDYSRDVIQLQPFECVVLRWPPKCESAIHLHKGFWGFVAVVQGNCQNVEYSLKNRELKLKRVTDGFPGAILKEPDGVIHKLVNPSDSEAVTIHFYWPPLTSFDNMKIYDTVENRMAILNDKATAASWKLSKDCYHKVEENAFVYVDQDPNRGPSHRMRPLIPKPGIELIRNGLRDYYNEQAEQYDFFDLRHESRRSYTEKINELIAEDLKTNHSSIGNYLALACGTGRRSLKIKKHSSLDFKITGVDLSEEMVIKAKAKGIGALVGDWPDVQLHEKFEAATFLYAFGHVENRERRLQSLIKIKEQLKSGAPFYLDGFNVNDKNEWGPSAVKTFEEQHLERFGYDRGEVFYTKSGGILWVQNRMDQTHWLCTRFG